MTVVLVEQRIDRCFHLADRVVLMEKGSIAFVGTPGEMVRWSGNKYIFFLPPVAQVFREISNGEVPLTIKEGRKTLRRLLAPIVPVETTIPLPPPVQVKVKDSLLFSRSSLTSRVNQGSVEVPLLETRNLGFAYPGKELCLRGINLQLHRGGVTAVLGENGAGKSTLLKNICGLLKPQQGKIYQQGQDITGYRAEDLSSQIGYLSQNPNDYLFNDTVEDEVAFDLKIRGAKDLSTVEPVLELLHLSELRSVNPRDLSGGEKQRVAMGTVLVRNPDVLLLDEPTRGLDVKLKHQLVELLQQLKHRGKSIVLVTHDIEFVGEVADRVIIMSDGEIVMDGGRQEVLANSLYYAPQVNRLFRGVDHGVMTVHDGVERIKGLLGKVFPK